MLLEAGANVNAQGGIYGNVLQAAAYMARVKVIHLGKVLALEVGAGQKVPGDIPLFVELLQDHALILMGYSPDYLEYEAKKHLNENRCSQDVFREPPESQGGKGGAYESKEKDSGRPETKQEFHEFKNKGGNTGTIGDDIGAGNETPLLGALNETSLKTTVHVWKLFGFTFLVFLLYILIKFWGIFVLFSTCFSIEFIVDLWSLVLILSPMII